MSGPMHASNTPAWIEANQRFLAAELARLKAQLAREDVAAARQTVEDARAAMPGPPAIDELATAFGLSSFERDVLLLCAGVEMDSALAARCAAVGEGGRPFATFGIALATLDEPHWSALTPVGPLRLWRLLDVKDEYALTTSRLTLDERVLHYLAGINYLDPRLRPLLVSHREPAALATSHATIVDAAVSDLLADDRAALMQLSGDDREGQTDIAHRVAASLGLQLFVMESADIPRAAADADALAILWHREAALLQAALLIHVDGDGAATRIAARLIDRVGGITFVAARRPIAVDRPDMRFVVERPGAAEQRELWTAALGPAAARCNGSLDGVAVQFRLSAGAILRTAAAVTRTPDTAGVGDRLWHACRVAVRGGLDTLAQRIEPVATWEDLVLPDPQFETLRQIAAHVRQRLTVYDAWGFGARTARGLGISALFSGESGTGKTMAAEVLANELRLDLYRIDLAATVSKYIGETEKNLACIFDAAEESGAILLFDEADALFGRRSEVSDSRDRYANIEVSYLLQRMEAYRGLAILTTNARAALDPAFQRRLRYVVSFPFPDQAQRERIWRGVFPPETPRAGVDPVRLAQLNVAGGSIRNIALNAAFLAAHAGTGVSMAHLLHAARSESAKRDRPFSDAEVRGWV